MRSGVESKVGGLVVLLNLAIGTVALGQGGGASSDGPGAFNHVEVRTTIVKAMADGAAVKQGDIVCVLDPRPVQSLIKAQAVSVKAAEASRQNAALDRELAEIAVVEYVDGTYKQDLETAIGAAILADSDLKRAEDRVAWSERMLERGSVSLNENVSAKLDLQRAKFALEQAQMRRLVLEKFTKDKTIKELKSAVEQANVEMLRRQAALELEKGKLESLVRQASECEVKAPAKGVLRFAPMVETGAVVR
ncbi:MAG: HlyD family secretion protein, partial [Isosphaeraceae bacterium]